MSHIHLGSEMTEVTEAYDFRGRTLIDRDGDKIGRIDDVYTDQRDGQPEWALVNTGLLGTKKRFVPLRDAQPIGGDVRVPLEKGHVKDAPGIDPDGELSESEERQLYTHYDVDYETTEQEEVVPKERVRLGTEEQTEQETISETLRKERIETDGDARS
jgi:sporulation protein YlmC with PRC-barrel domain